MSKHLDAITLIHSVSEYAQEHPEQRWGQAAFNYVYLTWPKIANDLRATRLDPFYHDHRVGKFVEEVIKRVGS